MSRYFTRAKVVDPDGWAINPGVPYGTIAPRDDERTPYIEAADFEATDTGLLDARGDAIWRSANPIGFGKDAEW